MTIAAAVESNFVKQAQAIREARFQGRVPVGGNTPEDMPVETPVETPAGQDVVKAMNEYAAKASKGAEAAPQEEAQAPSTTTTKGTNDALQGKEKNGRQESQIQGQEEVTKPLFDGLKKISDPGELSSYAKELEARAVELEAELAEMQERVKKSGSQSLPTKTEPTFPTKQTGALSDEDQLFIDPKGTIEKIKNEVRQETVEMLRREKAQEAFWGDFYKRNSDLRGLNDIVQLAYSQHADKMKSLTVDKGALLLAEKAREIVKRVKTATGEVETLPKEPAVTAGVSGGTTPKIAPKPAEERSMTMIEQVNAIRAKRVKTI